MRAGASASAVEAGKQGIEGTLLSKMIAECYVGGIMDYELFRQQNLEKEAVSSYQLAYFAANKSHRTV